MAKPGMKLNVKSRAVVEEDQMDIDEVINISPDEVEEFAATSEISIEKKRSKTARSSEKEQEKRKGGTQPAKKPKVNTVRDTFTFPEHDHALIKEFMWKFPIATDVPLNKSEVVRAGLHALSLLLDMDKPDAEKDASKEQLLAIAAKIEKLHGKNR